MRKFKLDIDMENDAFEGNQWRDEVKRLLKQVITDIDYANGGRFVDINGNDVGRWRAILPGDEA